MEDIIEEKLPAILNKYTDICKCQICVEDIKAIVLNKLPPHYAATEKGVLYIKTNELVTQFETDIIKEVVMAIEVVSQKPRHL